MNIKINDLISDLEDISQFELDNMDRIEWINLLNLIISRLKDIKGD